MKNFKYSWQQVAKASFVGIATTATFYLAKTTGLFSSWLLTEEPSDALMESKEIDTAINAGQRRLLQSSGGITLTNPIPDQVIQVGVQYQYSLDNVFSGNYSLIWAEQINQQPFPSWLSMQYKQLSKLTNSAGSYGYAVAVSGNTLFFADYSCLQIVDVSDPSNPRIVSTVASSAGGSTNGAAVSGNTLFVADGGAGSQIVDISNASNPRILSMIANGVGGSAIAVAINGSTLFVADGRAGLQVVDVKNTSNPRILSTVTSAGGVSRGIAIKGSTVFVADNSGGLQIVDVTNTSNPRIVSTLANSVAGSAGGVALSGNTLFVAVSSCLQIVDVSNTSNPRILSTVATIAGGNSLDVRVSGNTAFVTTMNGGLQIVDVGNVSNPRILSTVANSVFGDVCYGVAVNNSMVFVALYSGLQILDTKEASFIGVPPFTQLGQSWSLRVSARDSIGTTVSSSFTLTCDQLPRLSLSTIQDQSIFPGSVLNLPLQSSLLFTNPRNTFLRLAVVIANDQATPGWLEMRLTPITVSNLHPGGYAYAVAVSGNMVYVADDYAGLQIVDVSNPGNPQLISTVPSVGGQALGVAVSGNKVFVADFNIGLQIVDVSSVSNPRVVSTVPSAGGMTEGVAVSGNTLFVTDDAFGLQIMDVSNVSNPRIVSTVAKSAGGAGVAVAVSGNLVFVANGPGLHILDVSNVSSPRTVSALNISVAGFTENVVVSGNTLFVADLDGGLQIVDVSNISNPRIISSVANFVGGQAWGVAVSGATVFVADYYSIQIVDVNNVSNPQIISTMINDANAYAYDVAVSGNTLFVAKYSGGLQIIDISQWQLIATPGATDVGNYLMQVITTDDLGGTAATQPFTIRVEGPPRFNSTIPTQYAKVGQAFNYFIPQGLVSDPNFDSISFSAMLANNQSLPSWLSFSGISAAFVGTPQSNNVGNLTIVLSATDNIAGSANTTFMLVTSRLPVVNQRLSNAFARVNQLFQLLISNNTFSHPDGLPMNYSAQLSNQAPLPSWLRFNASALFLSGQPNVTDAGSYDLQLRATDIYAGQAATSFTITVGYGVQTNRLIDSQLAAVGQRYSYAVPSDSFINLDGATFSLQTGALPSWLTFTAISGQFSGTPLASSRGTMLITLTAIDLTGGTAMQAFNMTVAYFPQVVNPLADQIAPIGYPYQLNVSSTTFIDQNGYALTYRAEQSNGQSLPTWLNFNATTLQFSGLPNITQALRYSLAVIATNPLGAEGRDEFSIYAEHYPTVQQAIPDASAGVDIPLSLTIAGSSFNDLDNDVLSYNVSRMDRSPLPNWLTFDARALILSGTPLAAQIGNLSLLVTATDPSGGSAQQNFTLTVRYLPKVSQPVGSIAPVREERLLNYTLSPGTFTDSSGVSLNYNAMLDSGASLPSWLNFNAMTQNFLGTPTVSDVGTLNIRVIADDGQGGEASVSFSFIITPNYPPVVAKPVSNEVASVHQPFRLVLPPDTFTDANNDPLTYTAAQVDGQSLPRWLAFDEKTITFSGTPSRSDTGDFSERIIPIRLTARDDRSSAVAQFNINVQGTSSLALFIQIATPIATIFTAVFAAYKKRALCFNRYKKERYQRLDVEVKAGELFEHKFGDMKLLGKKILVKTPRQLQGYSRFFLSPRERVPGGGDMPSWMEYDIESNSLRSTIPVPDNSPPELVIQVKDEAGVVHEQFTLRITGLQSALVNRATADSAVELPTL